MSHIPKVSVIIIFWNAEEFIREAVESVLAQTFHDWELFLVDDGSTDAGSGIARQFAADSPRKVFCLAHPSHANRGMSASRNLGISRATGEYIAFLDADDVWLPHKLEQQVQLLDSHPSADLLYGNTLYWHSWTGEPDDMRRDVIPKLGVRPETLIQPPTLLPLFLEGKAAVPCTCSILMRREMVNKLGGFEESFTGLYEDQALYAKICLRGRVFVSGQCWDKYRQHAGSSCSIGQTNDHSQRVRLEFLNWLADYLRKEEVTSREVWFALRQEHWIQRHADARIWSHLPAGSSYRWTRVKRWFVRLVAFVLPRAARDKLWGGPGARLRSSQQNVSGPALCEEETVKEPASQQRCNQKKETCDVNSARHSDRQ